MEKRIAISCAALARIIVDGKYLLVFDKGTHKPIGGGLKFNKESMPFLESIGYNTDRTDNDLRIDIPENKYNQFKHWFHMFIDRETTVHREVMEELQPFLQVDISDMKETYERIDETNRDIGPSKMSTEYKNRLFQIHKVEFSDDQIEEIRSAVLTHADLVLVTKEQILNEEMNISPHAKHIL